MFLSMRLGWLFIDGAIFNGFCLSFNIILAISSIFSIVLIFLKDEFIKKDKQKLGLKLYRISFGLTIFFSIIVLINLFYNVTCIATYWYYYIKALPYILPIILALVCLYVVPKFKDRAKSIVSFVLIVVVVVTSVLFATKATVFKFEAMPSVYDLGNEYYSVIFATSHNSAGYIEYEKNGELVRQYDSVAGGIRSNDKVHSFLVEKDNLQNNSYKVGATRIIEHLGNSVSSGKSIESQLINFKGVPSDNMEIGILTDVHEKKDYALKAFSYCGSDFDGVILLGDLANMYNSQETFIQYVLDLSAKATNGEIPIFYARGNHDTRSAYASEMYKYMPISTGAYYYGFDFGSMSALVVDVAEDKVDTHIEYGGLANYEPYRDTEEEWLKAFDFNNSENIKHKIVISHIGNLENVFGRDWSTIISEKSPELLLCGHKHNTKYFEIGSDSQSMYYPTFLAGGINASNSKFVASKLVFEDNNLDIYSYNEKGDLVFSKKVS